MSRADDSPLKKVEGRTRTMTEEEYMSLQPTALVWMYDRLAVFVGREHYTYSCVGAHNVQKVRFFKATTLETRLYIAPRPWEVMSDSRQK